MPAGLTPFGVRIRELRRQRRVSQKQMAAHLQISAAYLSALERGQRGRPSPVLVDQICGYFNIIWDEADAMHRFARLSHPRIVIDTTEVGPEATELANRLAERINDLSVARVKQMLVVMTAEN
jgi:transcriptional regulator with XRE-family HTH domain